MILKSHLIKVDRPMSSRIKEICIEHNMTPDAFVYGAICAAIIAFDKKECRKAACKTKKPASKTAAARKARATKVAKLTAKKTAPKKTAAKKAAKKAPAKKRPVGRPRKVK